MIEWALAAGLASAAASSLAAAPGPNLGLAVSKLGVTAQQTVSELTVTAPMKCLEPERSPERAQRPKVVGSYPAKGEMVRPGILVVRVTFDLPMACYGVFTRDAPLQNPCPGTSQQMLLSYDRRTVRTVCIVEPDTQYGLWMSQSPVDHSFMGLGGLPSPALSAQLFDILAGACHDPL